MITTILSILGVIFLIWIATVFILNLIIYIIYKYTDDCRYTHLKRSTVIFGTEHGEWYIVPSFSFHIDSICKYPTIQFVWLKWQFIITYHFQTEDEETIEVRTRKEYLKERRNIVNEP